MSAQFPYSNAVGSRRRARRIALGFAAAALAVAAPVACKPASEPRGRVLLIGIDGASPRVVRELLQGGRLPHLAAIAREGASGTLRSHLPLVSPRIWTSIATGKLPAEHGIRGFAVTEPDGSRRLYRSSDRTAPALWNIATASGLTVGVVNWWTTHPLERVRGVMVSDHVLPSEIESRGRLVDARADSGGGVVWPETWEPRIRASIADDAPLTAVPDPTAPGGNLPAWWLPPYVARSRGEDEDVVRIALRVDAEVRPDLLMVFLPGIDRVSHKWWAGYEDPGAYPEPLNLSDAERAAGREALFRYYEFTDALIGRLLERFGPDDLVFVVSDHGFAAGDALTMGVHESDAALHGVYFARGPDVAQPEPGAPPSVNDVTPTILAWLHLPVGADMAGRPAAFLATASVPPVATWDATPVERIADEGSGAEAEILERLEALGYLEPEAGERPPADGADGESTAPP